MSDAAPTSQVLTDALALTRVDATVFDEAYTATTQYCPWPKAYGGDMVAQATVAAMRGRDNGGRLTVRTTEHSTWVRTR